MTDKLHNLRTRIQKLNKAEEPSDAKSVLYIMSRDCRVGSNHALLAAQQHALKVKLPLIVSFVVYDKQLGNRAKEHIAFLLEGLKDVDAGLRAKNIPFIIRSGQADQSYPALVKDFAPAAVYFDFSPLRHARQGKQSYAESAKLPVYVVDTHNIVPVWVASDKQEVGARTIRPKIHHHLPTYLQADTPLRKHPHSWPGTKQSEALGSLTDKVLDKYPSNGTDVSRFKPGEKAAAKALNDFVKHRLKGYATNRNDPVKNNLSELSPYRHFGQLSCLDMARACYEAQKHDSVDKADVDSFIEEMVIRKELSDNFCYYNDDYDKLRGAPEWAQNTLEKHAKDDREFVYTKAQFEKAETHDEAWNAAQRQLIRTGKIHGYMRMYWAKKVLEWSSSPQNALNILLYLNDFYHIDGGDPNGYVGIMWSVAGVHDRPWGERPVYGTIRSMVYNGLKRKFDIAAYIDKFN